MTPNPPRAIIAAIGGGPARTLTSDDLQEMETLIQRAVAQGHLEHCQDWARAMLLLLRILRTPAEAHHGHQ